MVFAMQVLGNFGEPAEDSLLLNRHFFCKVQEQHSNAHPFEGGKRLPPSNAFWMKDGASAYFSVLPISKS